MGVGLRARLRLGKRPARQQPCRDSQQDLAERRAEERQHPRWKEEPLWRQRRSVDQGLGPAEPQCPLLSSPMPAQGRPSSHSSVHDPLLHLTTGSRSPPCARPTGPPPHPLACRGPCGICACPPCSCAFLSPRRSVLQCTRLSLRDDFFQPSPDSGTATASPECVGGVGVAKQPQARVGKAMGKA